MNLVRIEDRGFCFTNMALQQGNIYYIVVHHSAGAKSANAVHAQHMGQGWAGIGYHFFIEPESESVAPLVVRGRPLDAIGAHCYGHNDGTVGVCLGGDYSTEKPTPADIFTLSLLIAQLCRKLDIDPALGVKPHSEFSATLCPGTIASLIPIIQTTASGILTIAGIDAILNAEAAEEIEAATAIYGHVFEKIRYYREIVKMTMERR